MRLSFNGELAKKIGVNQAIMFANMNNKEFNQWDMIKKQKMFPMWNPRKIDKIQNELKSLGYYSKYKLTEEELKEEVIKHKGQGNICEWCGEKNLILHKHHYPIPKSKGGTKTVNICPNCHYNYHF